MKQFVSKPTLITGAILMLAVLTSIYLEARPRTAPGQGPLTDIQNIETLRNQFNQDAGKTRLILLVSPT